MEGREQPIRVIGRRDRSFGSWDAIEFYGVGLRYTIDRYEGLLVGGGFGPGKRVEVSRGQGGQIASSSFPYTVERKDRVIYFPALKNGDEENLFGPIVSDQGWIRFCQNLDSGSSEDALLEVVLQGVTDGSHRVKVLLNDEEVGEVVFEGQ